MHGDAVHDDHDDEADDDDNEDKAKGGGGDDGVASRGIGEGGAPRTAFSSSISHSFSAQLPQLFRIAHAAFPHSSRTAPAQLPHNSHTTPAQLPLSSRAAIPQLCAPLWGRCGTVPPHAFLGPATGLVARF